MLTLYDEEKNQSLWLQTFPYQDNLLHLLTARLCLLTCNITKKFVVFLCTFMLSLYICSCSLKACCMIFPDVRSDYQ